MENTLKVNELKKQLLEEISKESSDNNIILSLSSEIAKLDNSQVRFSVDAGIINRLGKELVGKHETAVSELVKNAYDADATEVKLIFENAWNEGGILRIEDNGLGMTTEQLVNGFMRLSSSDKIHNPTSERYLRTRAGRKGIGRFATQRLGSKLTIITQTLNSNQAIQITINWDDFETDKDLLSINNSIILIPKNKQEGTDLIIENLRDSWSDSMIKRVFRYTSELLQPFPLSKKRKDEVDNKNDPGFKSFYFRKNNDDILSIIDDEDAIFKHALAEIEGYVLNDGQGCWSLKSDKLNFSEEIFLIGNNDKNRDDHTTPFNLIKGLHFKTYYFIYEPSLFAPGTFTFIRNLAYEKGGLRLYRNGFRVLPYGEQGDDWLGLDKSNNRSVVLGPHMNISFFGFVEVEDKEGKLEETSSREGIIESETSKEMIDFVYRSILSAVQKVSDIRGRKATASQKNFQKSENIATEKVETAISKIENVIIDGKSNGSFGSEKIKEAIEEIKQARQEEKEQIQNEKNILIDEINMLRILAGLGLVIGEFVHEVQRFLPGFDAEISYLKNILKGYKEALSRLELLDENVKAFTSYTSYFDKTISRNVIRELESIELRDIVKDFKRVIDNDLKRSKINFENPIFDGYDLFTVPMHPSEWASILFNLYTNSKKAIIRNRVEGKILISCGVDTDNLYLEFSDNGDGIQKENEDLIFNAFYTTTSAANHTSSDSESLVGTGLGLKIVKDIIEAYGGEIFVKSPSEGFNTTIRIEVPKNIENNE